VLVDWLAKAEHVPEAGMNKIAAAGGSKLTEQALEKGAET
jgi:hypothetical protein